MQKHIKSEGLIRPVVGALASLVLASFVAAATLGIPTTSLAAEVNDPTDRNITRLTLGLLEHSQFSHHQLDDEMASRFLDRYLDSLDPARLLFLQSDAQEFDVFRSRLPEMTRREGDTTPARTIFQCYLERLDQRIAYVTNLLQTGKFDFTGHDTWSFDREKSPRPANLDAARELWRGNLRAEYLQEKLAGRKPADIVATLTHRYTRLSQTMRKLTSEEVLDVTCLCLASARRCGRRTGIPKLTNSCPAARRPGAVCSSRATALSRSRKGIRSPWTLWTCRCPMR
jgi:hypothetical protein